MKDILEKLKVALKELENENGDVFLFALFLREQTFGKWDLLISAPWLDSRILSSYDKVAKRVQENLDKSEMTELARIAILNVDDQAVTFLQNLYSVPNGSFIEVANCEPLTDRFGFTIKRAYVLRCIGGKLKETSQSQ